MNIEQLIDYLKSDRGFNENVVSWNTVPAKDAVYSEFPDYIDRRLVDYYVSKGILKPYSHQRAAFDHARKKNDFVVVTPTASGKTLCYNVPVIDEIIKNPESRALYIFPTKALAQDQMHELNRIVESLELKIKTYTFDGDTPANARKSIRESGHVVITNPDMLHSGILPHHTIWVKLFENLKFVVIDEVHTYRGIFGSHFCNLLRRLERICNFYGSNPKFILCSATIANPKDHAEALTGRSMFLVNESGAPSGEKNFIIYNPPVVNENLGIRQSSVKLSAEIASTFIRNKITTIVFAKSRIRAEIITNYIKEKTHARLAAYRGGYLPVERRDIEHKMRSGELDGIVSTNALELGIDIGSLDAVISVGYPGSVSSLLQQFGRAGRRNSSSLSLLVANSSALDQYIAENPEFLTGFPPENAVINPDNLLILLDHIKCAAFELPFSETERFAPHISTTKEILDYLESEGILKNASGKYHWMNAIYPANEASLRSASHDNVVIVDATSANKVIGEVDLSSAPTLIHDEAIYIHQGRQFYIDKLDWERRTAFCHETDSDYYTDAECKTDIHVLADDRSIKKASFDLCYGEINIREQAMLYKKIKFRTHENIGSGKITLPEIEMHTSSFWIDFDEEYLDSFGGKANSGALLYSVGYILKNIAPVHLFCDPSDIRSINMSKSSFSLKPALFIADSSPGGSGLSAKLYDIFDHVALCASEHISRCSCREGCPGCIGPSAGGIDGVKKIICALLGDLASASAEQAHLLH